MGDDDKRQDLELVAFGDTATPEQRLAARLALARLAGAAGAAGVGAGDAALGGRSAAALGGRGAVPADGRGGAASPGPVGAVSVGDDPVVDPAPVPVVDVASLPRRSRRVTGAALLAAALVVGLIAGSLLTAHLASGTSPSASAATSSSASGSAVDGAVGQNPVLAGPDAVALANSLLAGAQLPSDVYPTTFDLNGTFVSSTTRLVGIAGSTERIFIARQRGSGHGFCLLSATVATTGTQSSGSDTCADEADFQRQGLTLGEGTFTVTWLGGTITIEVTGRG